MSSTAGPVQPVIGVIEDDPSVRKSLTRLLRSAGFGVVAFASTEQFLEGHRDETVHCLVVDIYFEGMSGLDLETYLSDAGVHFPIVFMSAHDDAALRESIKARGSVYLRKPFEESALLDAISRVLLAAPPRSSHGNDSPTRPRQH
jgi:FixJ family two-component response regulator